MGNGGHKHILIQTTIGMLSVQYVEHMMECWDMKCLYSLSLALEQNKESPDFSV